MSLNRTLEISSYQAVWAMLHRRRSVLVRPSRERLAGTVEVDETYIGGIEPGLPGDRARGKKVLTGIAVAIREPSGIGRCKKLPLATASLRAFVERFARCVARRASSNVRADMPWATLSAGTHRSMIESARECARPCAARRYHHVATATKVQAPHQSVFRYSPTPTTSATNVEST